MNKVELSELGLIPEEILKHQERIKSVLEKGSSNFISIIDCCRLENSGIVDPEQLKDSARQKPEGFVGFIPSAGAASRYFQALRPLEQALLKNSKNDIEHELNALSEQGAKNWALPKLIHLAMEGGAEFAINKKDGILEAINLPKALQPCVASGESFLSLKNLEHEKLEGLEGQVFITPPNKEAMFNSDIPNPKLKTKFIDQGPELSTIRFDLEGEPILDQNSKVSPVPAGHGTLVKLFPAVLKEFPQCHSVLIRNIDNVTGTSEKILNDTKLFQQLHQAALKKLNEIRGLLKADKITEASEVASNFTSDLGIDSVGSGYEAEDYPEQLRELYKLQVTLFHYQHSCAPIFGKKDPLALIKHLYMRPLNTMGQVPNSGKDVGGTPVYADISGATATICLEVPHASQTDKERFLMDPKKATHFNPVFVAAELIDNSEPYDSTNTPFWILAQKQFEMKSVLYHETVLYELLGNSIMANTLFPAIPRGLFNPHKTAKDTSNQTLESCLG